MARPMCNFFFLLRQKNKYQDHFTIDPCRMRPLIAFSLRGKSKKRKIKNKKSDFWFSVCDKNTIEQLIPCIRHAGEAPMAAVIPRIPADAVSRWMAVFPQRRQRCHVQQLHHRLHFAQNPLHHRHRRQRCSRVHRPAHRLSFSVAACFLWWCIPFCTTA